MTIGIGVLCSKPKPHEPRPDSIVMIADTMGSTETDSTDDLHKMWINGDLRLYAVGAGTLEYAAELFPIIETQVKDLPKRTHGEISGALNRAVHVLRSQHFQWQVMMPRFAMPGANVTPYEKVLEEWQQFDINSEVLLGTFDDSGQAFLYIIAQCYAANGQKIPGWVHLSEFPGYAAIGTGGHNAQFWLNYRCQVLGLSVKQSVYHAFEAKLMAAKAPTVNDSIEIVIALPAGKSFHLTEENPVIDDCPVALPELESMFKEYGAAENGQAWTRKDGSCKKIRNDEMNVPLAEGHLDRRRFGAMLGRIALLPVQTG